MKLEGGDGEVCTRSATDYRTLAVSRRNSKNKFSRNISKSRRARSRRMAAKNVLPSFLPCFQSIEEVTLDKMVSGSYGCLDSHRREGCSRYRTKETRVIYVKGTAIFLL